MELLYLALAAVALYLVFEVFSSRVSHEIRSSHRSTKNPKIDNTLNIKRADINGLELSSEQKKIYELIEGSSDNFYITGKAGTGKSLLLEYFAANARKRVVVLAPTGKAALNVEGATIHSFFRLPFATVDSKKVNVDYKTREILRNIDAIVIDEISMVRVDIMEAMDAKLRIARRSDLPFGGVQVIMFGDLYQLPPVVADGQLHRYFNHKFGGIYFFNAPSVKKAGIRIYELKNVFRQADSDFKKILNSIRVGDVSDDTLSEVNSRVGVSLEEKFVTLASTNAAVSRINHQKLKALEGEERAYVAKIRGDIEEASFPTEKKLRLKVGAQIVMLKNDDNKPRRWVNGTVGIVTYLGPSFVKVNIDGVDHTVNPEVWSKIRYEYDHEEEVLSKKVVSEFEQLPIRLAWAITIHKSQGQTYKSVAIDMSHGAFAHGQTYVALSRCSSLHGLSLTNEIRREDIIVDQEVVDFMRGAVD